MSAASETCDVSVLAFCDDDDAQSVAIGEAARQLPVPLELLLIVPQGIGKNAAALAHLEPGLNIRCFSTLTDALGQVRGGWLYLLDEGEGFYAPDSLATMAAEVAACEDTPDIAHFICVLRDGNNGIMSCLNNEYQPQFPFLAQERWRDVLRRIPARTDRSAGGRLYSASLCARALAVLARVGDTHSAILLDVLFGLCADSYRAFEQLTWQRDEGRANQRLGIRRLRHAHAAIQALPACLAALGARDDMRDAAHEASLMQSFAWIAGRICLYCSEGNGTDGGGWAALREALWAELGKDAAMDAMILAIADNGRKMRKIGNAIFVTQE